MILIIFIAVIVAYPIWRYKKEKKRKLKRKDDL